MTESDCIESQTPQTVCPECGHNVVILRDTKRSWTHTSRMTASIIWLVCVLGLIGYWISLGTSGYYKSQVDLREPLGSEFRLAFTPWTTQQDLDPGFLSTDELNRAIQSDAESLTRVSDALQLVVDTADVSQFDLGLIGIKYGLIEPTAVVIHDTEYNLGGNWITLTSSESLLDARDQDSIDPERVLNWERTRWQFFPIFSYWKTSSDTRRGISTGYQVRVRFLTIIGVLCVCVLVVTVFRWIGALAGKKVLGKKTMRIGAISALFFVCTVGAILTSRTSVSRSSMTSYQNPISVVYPIEELRAIAQNPEKAIEWSAEILSMYPEHQQGDLLVGQFRVFDENSAKSTHMMELDVYEIAIGYRFSLFIWARGTYGQAAIESEILQHQARSTRLRSLQYEGALTHKWGPPRSMSYIKIRIVHLTLTAVALYWMWAFFQWVSQLFLRRVQRRRARRDQCIFCSYPLTAEAVNARYPLEMT